MRRKLLLLLLFTGPLVSAFAQSENESSRTFGANKFLLTGNAEAVLQLDTGTANFTDVNFKPIFLWKLSDRLFVESEVEIETGDGAADIGLEYVNMCYMLNPYMTIHGGRFLPKFGAYRGKLGEAFINRFSTDPVGFGDGGIGTMDEVGVGLQGGLPMGSMKMSYDVWVTNGPQLATDGSGSIDYEAYTDNNKNKAIGGRVGILPLSNSSLELGFSYENVGDIRDINEIYNDPAKKVGMNMMAIDLNYFSNVSALKSTIRVIGEYKNQTTDNFDFVSPGDTTNTSFAATNGGNTYYASLSIRPTQSENKVLRNFELAGRYSNFEKPTNDVEGNVKTNRTELALDYWLKWNSVVKLCYIKTKDATDVVRIQMVVGF
jgi:hypothetical protein